MLFCHFFQEKIEFFSHFPNKNWTFWASKLNFRRVVIIFFEILLPPPKIGDDLWTESHFPWSPFPSQEFSFWKKKKKWKFFRHSFSKSKTVRGDELTTHSKHFKKKFFAQKMYWKSQKNFFQFENRREDQFFIFL